VRRAPQWWADDGGAGAALRSLIGEPGTESGVQQLPTPVKRRSTVNFSAPCCTSAPGSTDLKPPPT
jgi:hypothetical protein